MLKVREGYNCLPLTVKVQKLTDEMPGILVIILILEAGMIIASKKSSSLDLYHMASTSNDRRIRSERIEKERRFEGGVSNLGGATRSSISLSTSSSSSSNSSLKNLSKLFRISGPTHRLKKTAEERFVIKSGSADEKREIDERKRSEIGRFDFYSSSSYSDEEDRIVKDMIDKLVGSRSHWSAWPNHQKAGNDNRGLTDLKHYLVNAAASSSSSSLPSTPSSKIMESDNLITGVESCVINGTVGELAYWNWNFCSAERTEWNMKVDVVREVQRYNSDHSMTIMHRMWLPRPLNPRDYVVKQIWKRIGDDTICVAVYDDHNSFISAPVRSDNLTTRASKKALILLEGVKGKRKTKVTHFCEIKMAGGDARAIPKEILEGHLRSNLTIVESMVETTGSSYVRDQDGEDCDDNGIEGGEEILASREIWDRGFLHLLSKRYEKSDPLSRANVEASGANDFRREDLDNMSVVPINDNVDNYDIGDLGFVKWLMKNRFSSYFQGHEGEDLENTNLFHLLFTRMFTSKIGNGAGNSTVNDNNNDIENDNDDNNEPRNRNNDDNVPNNNNNIGLSDTNLSTHSLESIISDSQHNSKIRLGINDVLPNSRASSLNPDKRDSVLLSRIEFSNRYLLLTPFFGPKVFTNDNCEIEFQIYFRFCSRSFHMRLFQMSYLIFIVNLCIGLFRFIWGCHHPVVDKGKTLPFILIELVDLMR